MGKPERRTLESLASEESRCTRCPLYRDATQVVPGEGSPQSRLMLVGEQPGDKEDLAGHPFVGPAGRLLDRALKDAGIARDTVFVTNAVKHFKHETRGKRRLHKRPGAGEIDRCKWWLDLEREIIRPEVTVALGATAVRSLLGRPRTVSGLRGTAHVLEDGSKLLVTVHPSALLRTRDTSRREADYAGFVDDLRTAREALED